MLNCKSQTDLIPSMFISTAVAMIFTQLAGYGAVLIDGIITSRALGNLAYSAISLLVPFNSVIVLMSNAISVGSQVVSSQAIGRGEKDKAVAAFTVAVIAVIVMSLLLIITCIAWPLEIFGICGVSLETYSDLRAQILPEIC